MHYTVTAALAEGHGVLARRAHPGLRNRIDAALRRGELRRVLPGIYVAGEPTLEQRARAACLADPGAVVLGAAAAHLVGWTHPPVPESIAVATRIRAPQPGFRWELRRIPARLTRRLEGGVRVTSKALTALDLADEFGDEELERALRAGVPLADLTRALALTPGRRGRAALRRAVATMWTRPWSPAELRAHAALLSARIGGWEANWNIYDRWGEQLLGCGDLVFDGRRLVLEIDGAHHLEPQQVLSDKARDLRLAREGWEVVRIGASLALDHPEDFVAIVRDVLASRPPRRRRRSRKRGRARGDADASASAEVTEVSGNQGADTPASEK